MALLTPRQAKPARGVCERLETHAQGRSNGVAVGDGEFPRPLLDASRHPQSALRQPRSAGSAGGDSHLSTVAELLAAQTRDGYWVKRDYYLPRTGRGTFWVLSVLGDLGLTVEDEHVRRACDFMFTHQRENGAFCRRRRVSGQGTVWQKHAESCTHARIVRFLIQFGYAKDPRVRKAIDWLLPIQRDDGMWLP